MSAVSELRERNIALGRALYARYRGIVAELDADPMLSGVTCAACEGTGQTAGFACPGFVRIVVDCTTCAGSGVIDRAIAAAAAESELARLRRAGAEP